MGLVDGVSSLHQASHAADRRSRSLSRAVRRIRYVCGSLCFASHHASTERSLTKNYAYAQYMVQIRMVRIDAAGVRNKRLWSKERGRGRVDGSLISHHSSRGSLRLNGLGFSCELEDLPGEF